jgi:signal transduction histidine kinase
MTWHAGLSRISRSTAWMAGGVCVSVIMLTWYGYYAIREWQRSSTELAERRANETADLLVTALTRDMRGVQDSILTFARWDDVLADSPDDVSSLVAGAFARYPYPETFFAWRNSAPSEVWFFNRSERRPDWISPVALPTRFPVIVSNKPYMGDQLMARIRRDAAQGRRFSAFETRLGAADYQVVARLLYGDAFRERLERVFGFTVNLNWVRTNYFPELTKQVAEIGTTGAGLDLAVRDERDELVTSTQPEVRTGRPNQRPFALLFFDPRLVALDQPADLPRRLWAVEVAVARDPTLTAAIKGADRTLIIAALAAVSLAVSLVFTGRALRAGANLAEMRTEFVSTVTHELKTPIATIRAAGDTLLAGRVANAETAREYAQMVVQEAKRLTRLVDNLLAYARVTDVADVYSFEPLSIDQLVHDVLERFRPLLDASGFHVIVDVPEIVPAIRADRTAMELLLDNVVDNAIRYSGDGRLLKIAARRADPFVRIEVTDEGIGIPDDEIERVTRKFVRGRLATSGGSGLGLAIASRIAKDHGGRIAIVSRVRQATCVTVSIPIATHDGKEANSHR